MSLFIKLREQYPVFVYHGYKTEISENKFNIQYHFEIEGLSSFYPQWEFKLNRQIADNESDLIENLVFSLGLVELISYWKATCSPNVIIKPHGLTSEMIEWWKKLYFGGLGEFFYTNEIKTDINSFMHIEPNANVLGVQKNHNNLSGAIVPVGGGKDSAVSLRILNSFKNEIMPYIINGRDATSLTCKVAGYKNDETIIVKRTIDKNLILLNSKGFLNGHTPFSAIVAFSSVLAAYFNLKKYVILSNESSANESTVLGEDINHQFSKGEDFENDFIEYEKKYINSGVEYFSFLRPLSELQIAMLFAQYKEYHSIFKSCNVGSKKDIWCCNCPKCLFVYIILSPFLTKEELIGIFGEDLLDKIELLDTFKQLTGFYKNKPFECVGSRDEVLVCAKATLEKLKKEGEEIPALLRFFEESGLSSENNIDFYVNFFDIKNHLPTIYKNVLVEELKERLGYVSQN